MSGTAATTVSLIVARTLSTGVTMVFGELVPKNLAIARPLATARAVQGFQRGFARSTLLIVRLFNGMANAILRRLGIEPQEELASARSPEELASLVRRSAQHGTLELGRTAEGEVTLDFDSTGVEVYGCNKPGATVNYKGSQRRIAMPAAERVGPDFDEHLSGTR